MLITRIYITGMTDEKNTEAKKERNKAFGQRLKISRQGKKITQEQLAESVGKSSETISKLERGLIYPGVDMLILLAERLNTSLDNLVGTHTALGMSKAHNEALTEIGCVLAEMDEDKLKVALLQLKALQAM
jgi:transcriptional regulator with XRE-family HTH domain